MINFHMVAQNPRVLKAVMTLNALLWFIVIIPNMYVKGLSNSLVSLKSSPYCFLTCLILFLSIALQFLYLIHQLQTYLLGSLLLSERQLIFSNLIKDNPGLQLILILMQEQFRNSVESLIWAVVFLLFAWGKAACVIIISRLNDNKLKNLEKFNFLVIGLTSFVLICNFVLFRTCGLWIFVMLNFEAVFILKDCVLAYYQITNTRTLSASTELRIEIIENLLKLSQWLQIGFTNGSIISTNPVEFLLMIKLQTYIMSFFNKCSSYSRYRSSIQQFTLKYPPLSDKDFEELVDEKCCVCWDLLHTATSCRITCGHVIHVECIWKWMLRNSERKCPLCKQTFLEPDASSSFSLLSIFSFFARGRSNEEDLRRMMEVFPNLSEQELLREVERAGSVQQAIDNLLGE